MDVLYMHPELDNSAQNIALHPPNHWCSPDPEALPDRWRCAAYPGYDRQRPLLTVSGTRKCFISGVTGQDGLSLHLCLRLAEEARRRGTPLGLGMSAYRLDDQRSPGAQASKQLRWHGHLVAGEVRATSVRGRAQVDETVPRNAGLLYTGSLSLTIEVT